MALLGASDMAKYDDMSFSKAFAAARKEMGKGKTFTWKGKSYSTDYKEESKERKTTPAKSPAPRPRPVANRDEITMSVLPKTYQQATQESGARRSRNAASERSRRTVERARAALARASAESEAKDKFTRARNRPVEYTYEQWKNMSRGERERAGLPVSEIGGQLAFDRFMSKNKTVTGRSSARPPRFEDR
jgi:hypothetical protein